jgi:hypothetical protein
VDRSKGHTPSRWSKPSPGLAVEDYERLAADLVFAFDARDDAALQRLNAHYGRSFTHDDVWAEAWRRVYAFRQRAFKSSAKQVLLPDEARTPIAQDAGFGSWAALVRAGGGGRAAGRAGRGRCGRKPDRPASPPPRHRVLTRQGPHTPGGAYDYVINGRMLAGFALLAYPAQYGNTGIATFVVNQGGKSLSKGPWP